MVDLNGKLVPKYYFLCQLKADLLESYKAFIKLNMCCEISRKFVQIAFLTLPSSRLILLIIEI